MVAPTRHGIYVEFVGSPGHPLTTASLEDRRAGVRLLNVRKEGEGDEEKTLATVYIPRRKGRHFIRRLEEYRDQDTAPNKEGLTKPKNQHLIDSIDDIRSGLLRSFWTDALDLLPGASPAWVEVWLAIDSEDELTAFREQLQKLGIEEHPDHPLINFPERKVVLIRANRNQLQSLVEESDSLAELRIGKEPCTFFFEIENAEQADLARDLLARLTTEPDNHVSVCILDTGVNRGHPVLQPLLSVADCHSVDPGWGVADHNSHGTLMAGLAAYGDLQSALQSTTPITVGHRLESVKILPPPPAQNPRHLWGHVTKQGVFRAEIQEPNRRRVIGLAITSKDTVSAGKPTSWSGAVDQLAAGEGENKRLVVVSAGNADPTNLANYPQANFTDQIQDPAQAWNALTVGAMTELTQIIHPDFQGFGPLAPAGALAPCSCTSAAWDPEWPVKPDVVFEGGNKARGPQDSIESPEELQILSTWHKFARLHFAPFDGTSAATAQASWFAAQILDHYPAAWPETIRGLVVHSADWTPAMLQLRHGQGKSAYLRVIRCVGYGKPDLGRAVNCLQSRLTLVTEHQIKPYAKRESGTIGTNEIHLHELPWPREVLEDLGEVEIQMRVTLSYFVEPGPGEIGWKDRYRYPSHGLRFDLNSPGENREEFMKRINAAAVTEGDAAVGTPSASDHWTLGTNLRDRGSIHSDIWRGRAADLSASNLIAVFPTSGWWKERAHLNRWNSEARYSLIVSIHSPSETADIYTPVVNALAVPIPVEVQIEHQE